MEQVYLCGNKIHLCRFVFTPATAANMSKECDQLLWADLSIPQKPMFQRSSFPRRWMAARASVLTAVNSA